jgi:hypothetical protein
MRRAPARRSETRCDSRCILSVPDLDAEHWPAYPGVVSDEHFDPDDPDEKFFRGVSNDLPAFTVPVTSEHEEEGRFPWWSLDDAGDRLVRFAHRFGSYDWSSDPDQPKQQQLLVSLASGEPDDAVDGHNEFLWHCLVAVVRADRFNEGLIAEHALALTRIANELRRRLLRRRMEAPPN